MTATSGLVRALQFTAPGMAEVGTRPRPVARPDETLVAPRFVGICATDIELRDGTHPYFAQGKAVYPLQPGHEWSGVVVESSDPGFPAGMAVVGDPEVSCGRAGCEHCSVGRIPWCPDRREIGCRGHLDGAAAELVSVPTRNLRPVPDGVDLRAAVLAEPATTVFGGLHRAGDVRGRRVLVVGAGTIGRIAAQVLGHAGAEVTVAVRRPGSDASWPFQAIVVPDPERDPLPPAFPVVFVAAGTPSAVQLGIRALANGGQLVLLGVPAERVDGIDIAAILHKDATVHGVLNYSSAGPGQFVRALDAIAEGAIDPEPIIDTVLPLREAQQAFARAGGRGRPRPKVMLDVSA
jgi:2-desacetyl-2-hydroxyethyl bacteriochlorophyllide A dehydrogenase